MRYLAISVHWLFVLAVLAMCGIGSNRCLSADDKPSAVSVDRDALLSIHQKDALEYTLFRDASKKEKLVFRQEPVYRWSNPTRSGGQVGDVFIWTVDGRAEAIATIFSHLENGRRVLCHELHSLSPSTIAPDRKTTNRWSPRGGLVMRPLTPAAEPAETAVKRLIQLRNLARDFSARSRDEHGEQWELRLLPQPLYRYENVKGDVFDGAVFAFVTTAGTDPEIVMKIEATSVPDKPAEWRFAAARFSDLNLYLSYKNQEVWTSIRSQENAFDRNRDETFRFYRDRVIHEVVTRTDAAGKGAP